MRAGHGGLGMEGIAWRSLEKKGGSRAGFVSSQFCRGQDLPHAAAGLTGLGGPGEGQVRAVRQPGRPGEGQRWAWASDTHGSCLLLLEGQGFLLCFWEKPSYQKNLQAKLRASECGLPKLAPHPEPAVAEELSCWERTFSPACHFIEFSRGFYF